MITVLLVFAAPAFAEPRKVGEPPCYYRVEDARRMDFMTAYEAANRAELEAGCLVDNPTVERLKAEPEAISKRAEARNPDVDLSTMEGTTGYDVCRIPPGDRDSMCEKNDDVARSKFALAMTELRNFTKKWR